MIVKRTIDIFLGFLILILFFPFLLITGLIIFIELKSFPIFIQERGLTLNKYRFKIYKLKTIKNKVADISHSTEQDIFLKFSLQDKVSPFAKWLRKTGLDELPQLVNVIIGNMSLIGPRPLMLEDLETMKRISPDLYECRENLTNKPGISGLWQLFGNRSEGILGMIALESLYERVASPLFDLKLLVYTISIVLQAKNSDSIFYTEKALASKVKTIIDSSSNLKVTLNMPEGISKFILEKVQKHDGKYTVEIPHDWWYVSDTYKTTKSESKEANIFPIDKKNNKDAI